MDAELMRNGERKANRCSGRPRGAIGAGRRRALRCARNLLLVAGCMACGCGTVLFEVPPGSDVRLLEQDEPVTVTASKKVWYALWGNEPLSDNSTAEMIAEHNLREVRMATEQTLLDNIISMCTGVIGFSLRTVIVEGNP